MPTSYMRLWLDRTMHMNIYVGWTTSRVRCKSYSCATNLNLYTDMYIKACF